MMNIVEMNPASIYQELSDSGVLSLCGNIGTAICVAGIVLRFGYRWFLAGCPLGEEAERLVSMLKTTFISHAELDQAARHRDDPSFGEEDMKSPVVCVNDIAISPHYKLYEEGLVQTAETVCTSPSEAQKNVTAPTGQHFAWFLKRNLDHTFEKFELKAIRKAAGDRWVKVLAEFDRLIAQKYLSSKPNGVGKVVGQ